MSNRPRRDDLGENYARKKRDDRVKEIAENATREPPAGGGGIQIGQVTDTESPLIGMDTFQSAFTAVPNLSITVPETGIALAIAKVGFEFGGRDTGAAGRSSWTVFGRIRQDTTSGQQSTLGSKLDLGAVSGLNDTDTVEMDMFMAMNAVAGQTITCQLRSFFNSTDIPYHSLTHARMYLLYSYPA